MNPWAIDGLVVLAYFVVIISIGLYKGRGEKTLEEFAVAHRSIPWWAVLASIMAAEVSAATFLGTPDEGYEKRNLTYVQLSLGTIIARVIVAYLFIQRYYDLRVVSIYEFLETRFGRSTKLASSAMFLVTRALASGSRMYAPAVMLVMAWELIRHYHPGGAQTLWLYAGAVGTLTLFTAVYTAFGGIKAVVWTDLLQVILMYGAMCYAIVFPLAGGGRLGGGEAAGCDRAGGCGARGFASSRRTRMKMPAQHLSQSDALQKAHDEVEAQSAESRRTR